MAQGETVKPAPRRGRPRSESSRQAILAAASELLLQHGLSAISMDAVAERAGVSKATIYRWWPSKELLALDAVFSDWEPAPPDTHDTGSLGGDLLSLIRPWARQLASKPYARVTAGLISRAQDDPEFGREYRERFLQPRREQARLIFKRAIDRGEIPPGTDVETALDLLYGPFYHRLLQGHAELNDRFTDSVVAFVAAGVARGDG
jgi:AcrR family transcriptional regulator